MDLTSPPQESDAEASEPLAWGIVANVSRDLFIRQEDDRKRPGTRHFVPGAKVWVLPVQWGDGGEKRFVVGTRRRTSGKQLIRLVMPSDRLVNYRVKPIYSPSVFGAMTRDWNEKDHLSTAELANRRVGLFESKEDAEEVAASHRWARTRGTHLLGRGWNPMHRADESCEFCDGRDAFWDGNELSTNPHEPAPDLDRASTEWWGTPHGMWLAGWRSEAQLSRGRPDAELAIRLIADRRAASRERAAQIARFAIGRTAHELESPNLLPDRNATVRFLRGDYEPRRLDGVVHSWVDDSDVVTRTQYA